MLLMVAGLCCASFHPYAAEGMSKSERQQLLNAIEDYNFSDLAPAIATLETLLKKFPDNPEALHYLAMAYEESGRTDEAAIIYKRWLKAGGESLEDNMREAWLGLARVLEASGDSAAASQTLKRWVGAHADDYDSLITYGDLLVKERAFDEASDFWLDLLKQKDLKPKHQSAAHYYLAYIALSEGRVEEGRAAARQAVDAYPGGQYARSAGELLEMDPSILEKSGGGIAANIHLGEFYTSNVDLLPDIVPSSTGKPKNDWVSQADVMLAYQLPRLALGYSLNGQWHRTRLDFDVLMHSLFLQVPLGQWTLMPRYSYTQLAKEYLFQEGGMDISWARGDGLTLSYQFHYQQFSKNFGSLETDLRRLGGFTNGVSLGNQFAFGPLVVVGGVSVTMATTRGDSTHIKTDDYVQLGGNVTVSRSWPQLMASLSLSAHRKAFMAPDLTLLQSGNAKRLEAHAQIAGEVGYTPMMNRPLKVTFGGHWQVNRSNYKEPFVLAAANKEYFEWQWNVGVNYSW